MDSLWIPLLDKVIYSNSGCVCECGLIYDFLTSPLHRSSSRHSNRLRSWVQPIKLNRDYMDGHVH